MEVDGFTSTLILQLDFDKYLKTPKVRAQDAYSSSSISTHLLGIYCANDGKIYCFFFYDETTWYHWTKQSNFSPRLLN